MYALSLESPVICTGSRKSGDMLGVLKVQWYALSLESPAICTGYRKSSDMYWVSKVQWYALGLESPVIHWKNNFFRIDFWGESYWVIESSRIKYLKDSRPKSFWYYSTIYYLYISTYGRTWWKIPRWKKWVYIIE